MDKHAIKFGILYTDILKEADGISEEDTERLKQAQENYCNNPSDANQKNLYETMVQIVKNS